VQGLRTRIVAHVDFERLATSIAFRASPLARLPARSSLMPWYVMLCAGIYALDTLWLGAVASEMGSTGLLALPAVVIKLAVMFVALAWWDSDFCVVVAHGHVLSGILIVGTISTCIEGYAFVKAVLMNPERAIADDNFTIVDTLLRRVVVPGVVLYFAIRVFFQARCMG
jgi:hypothetical protein